MGIYGCLMSHWDGHSHVKYHKSGVLLPGWEPMVVPSGETFGGGPPADAPMTFWQPGVPGPL